MTHRPVDPSTIPGWGIDADPRNDPTYPMRDVSKETGDPGRPMRLPRQEPRVELLVSIERTDLPAVFGTTVPPSGLSGTIRRSAFRYSESHWAHWLMLMAADRVNVVEGVVQDLGRGRIPNVPAEMGVRAEWAHNRTGLVQKVAIVGALMGLGWLLLRRRAR
ncbi:hypothetical protein [Methylobacterium sp. Leaf118]|uniref:hypothetical protein n=1 Tax=Methylobacterium sp. Leaf118 TaxID=2876562 RepID=UPI001E4B8333|nr:hypothetical protein [Methylobacterium sp. Leaf118]